MADTARPRWSHQTRINKASEALDLAQQYRADVEARLPEGTIDHLLANLALLDPARARAVAARADLAGRTAHQNRTVAELALWDRVLRFAVRNTPGLPPAVRKTAGVGSATGAGKTVGGSVASAAKMSGAAQTHPEAMRKAGILPQDVAVGATLTSGTLGADLDQEAAKPRKKQARIARDVLERQVEDDVMAIARAGALAFGAREQPSTADIALAQRFMALIEAPRAGRARKPAPTPPA